MDNVPFIFLYYMIIDGGGLYDPRFGWFYVIYVTILDSMQLQYKLVN